MQWIQYNENRQKTDKYLLNNSHIIYLIQWRLDLTGNQRKIYKYAFITLYILNVF